MLSNFEVKALARLTHKDAMENAQKSRLVRSVKRFERAASDKTSQFVSREAKPCHC